MGKQQKTKFDVLSGKANANIRFDDLCALLISLGFKERTRSSHRIFSRSGVFEILNLQPLSDSKAKPYQVRQVRNVIEKYNL